MQQKHRQKRVLRGSLSAAFATFAALCSHAIAGGAWSFSILAMLIPLVLSTPVCIALSSHKFSLPRLDAVVLTSQFVFHTLFEALAKAHGPVMHHHHAFHPSHSHQIQVHVPTRVAESHHLSISMWLAHFIVVVVTVAVIYKYELLISALITLTHLVIRRFLKYLRLPLVPITCRAMTRDKYPIPLLRFSQVTLTPRSQWDLPSAVSSSLAPAS